MTDRNTQEVNQQVLPLVLPEEEREAEKEKIKIGRLIMPLDCGYGLTQEFVTRNGASPDNFISTQPQKQTQPYLSELIWLVTTKSTERERENQTSSSIPPRLLKFRDGHFLSTIFLILQFGLTLVLSRESFDKER